MKYLREKIGCAIGWLLIGWLLLGIVPSDLFAQGLLPSWGGSDSRKTILQFVEAVTDKSSSDYRPPHERIAVLDNDGTLWSEKPFYFQAAFAIDRVKAQASKHPEWKAQEPFHSILNGDLDGVLKSGYQGVAELIAATHGDLTTEEFDRVAREWINTAKHPTTGRPYREMVFQPMQELLQLLREKEFDIWIVSGGGMEFLRAWTNEVYGIPPDHVVGSYLKSKFELRDGVPHLVHIPEIEFVNDHAGKVVGIHRFIRRRPIAAFGNSDGDLEMLQWTTTGPGKTLGVYIHHTDADREWSYDRKSSAGQLDVGLNQAAERGWTVVDMKNDWQTIHPPPKTP